MAATMTQEEIIEAIQRLKRKTKDNTKRLDVFCPMLLNYEDGLNEMEKTIEEKFNQAIEINPREKETEQAIQKLKRKTKDNTKRLDDFYPMLLNYKDELNEMEKTVEEKLNQAIEINPREKETEQEKMLKLKLIDLENTNQLLKEQLCNCTTELDSCKQEITHHSELLMKLNKMEKIIEEKLNQAIEINPREKETEQEKMLKLKIIELENTDKLLKEQLCYCTNELDSCKQEITHHSEQLMKLETNYFTNIMPVISKFEKENDKSNKQKNIEKEERRKFEEIQIQIDKLFETQEKELKQLKEINALKQQTVYKVDLEQHKCQIHSESEYKFEDILKQMSSKFRELHEKLVKHANEIIVVYEKQIAALKDDWKQYKNNIGSEIHVLKTLVSGAMNKVEAIESNMACIKYNRGRK